MKLADAGESKYAHSDLGREGSSVRRNSRWLCSSAQRSNRGVWHERHKQIYECELLNPWISISIETDRPSGNETCRVYSDRRDAPKPPQVGIAIHRSLCYGRTLCDVCFRPEAVPHPQCVLWVRQ
jgi:hypothetical protein